MFKSILPVTKRNPGADGKDVSSQTTATTANLKAASCDTGEGKENNRPSSLPQRSPAKSGSQHGQRSYDGRRNYGQQQPTQTALTLEKQQATDQDFEKLLDDLQIPMNLRSKLATLDSPVKAAMLRSSHVLASPDPVSPPSTRATKRPKLRRSLSSANLHTPRAGAGLLDYGFPRPPGSPVTADSGWDNAPLAAPVAPFMLEGSGRPSSALGHHHVRGSASLDMPRSTSQVFYPNGSGGGRAGSGRSPSGFSSKPGSKGPSSIKELSPATFCVMLSETPSTQLDVEIVKKLRLLLRNESASWSEAYLRHGGYATLLTRLTDILDVEWREEQHDDQILHELLRCFKALSTSSIGCFALRSSCPTPFVQLMSLLYSDKKPGDLCTRQLIVDLLHILFDLYPAASCVSTGQDIYRRCETPTQTSARPSSATGVSPIPVEALPAPHKTLYSLVRALLLTPAPPPTESPSTPISPHAFIASLHLPRIFKTYLQELSDVCRDYFWVFCHPQNTIWHLEQTDQAKVERPRPPGGMTGGVEFEAMGYLTSHFQLLNSLAKAAEDLDLPPENEFSAHRFHSDLFASGMERIILTTRKASTTYYVMLHLEIARYVAHAIRARYEIPWGLSRLIGAPPAIMLKGGAKPSGSGTPQSSPIKSKGIPGGAPRVPTPKKVEPIKL